MSDDIVREFLVESNENLDSLDRELVQLEKDPANRDTLASIFRTIHTIKGTCGFLGFNKLESVAHVGENLLSRLRDGALALSPEITTALLRMVDAIRQMLASIEASGNEGQRDDTELIAILSALMPVATGGPAAQPLKEAERERPVQEAVRLGEILVQTGLTQPSEVEAALEQQAAGDSRQVGEILVDKGVINTQDVSEALKSQQQNRNQVAATDASIRVDVTLLDKLMNLVGELVLARNQIVQFTNTTEDTSLTASSQRLNLITTELQEGVMKTRMQPIGNIWSKFPRTVRDVAAACGKQIRIEMEGKETELDKTIIEAIKDPLTHIVRNSADHGIEMPDRRVAEGKAAEGRLLLRAYHEGGQVIIEISDDGAGLDHEKIRRKALEKGLITPEQIARLSEREAVNLIFMPGLSTAEKVTNVSGRGVGMDVVRTNIEKIGGTVDVQSTQGQGTTVRMKIPLTLAIIPALIVTSAGDRYAIPQVSLLELVRLEGEHASTAIENVHGAPVYRLRGRLLPLVYLNQELNVEAPVESGSEREGAAPANPDLDFTMVRNKHKEWMNTLQKVLDGRIAMTPQEAGSHHDCALGRWIDSIALQRYDAIRELRQLVEVHAQFHDTVRSALTLKASGQEKQARQELEVVGQLSGRILAFTRSVERKVAALENVNIVILQADDQQFGLLVDGINDTEEIVVKPLGKRLKSINMYAGATIMGDGKVALILDVLGLAQCAHVVSGAHDHALAENENLQSVAKDASERKPVLLFEYGDNLRMAIDLSMVARLEEFKTDAIEVADGKEAVQYRGQIMPLIRVSDVLQGEHSLKAERPTSVQVVVCTDEGRNIGLVIDRILDIAEEAFVVERQTGRRGVLGSAVIQKRITDLLDVPGLIAAGKSSHLLAMAAHG
jgi:chemotaxis protein histidine kinase CheA